MIAMVMTRKVKDVLTRTVGGKDELDRGIEGPWYGVMRLGAGDGVEAWTAPSLVVVPHGRILESKSGL